MANEKFVLVAVSALVSLLAMSPVAYMAYRNRPPAVVSVDLQKLVEDEQRRTIDIINKSNGVISAEQRQTIEKNTADFAKKLSDGVEHLGSECACIIVNKAALLGGVAPDYTDRLREMVKRHQQ